MAKKKSKLKKVLKSVAPLLAVAGLGKAFMNARNRKDMINSANADDGFGFMKLKDFGPYTIGTDRSQLPRVNPMLTEEDYNSDFFTGASAKKGGRIVKTKSGGKALRGYGRAYLKGRK